MPGYDVSLLSRRQQAAMPSTYQAAVPVDIAPLDFAVNGAVAADAEDAAAAIVRLDTYVSSVFGEDDIAPMRSVLLRSESAASSQIENLTVGARQLALAELGATASHNAKLVAQNVAAMDAAVRLSERLDAEAILSMHKVLLRDRPDQAGRWREQQVWIGASGVSPAGAAFVPPHHDRVPAAIADLVQFLARNDLPVLVHAAIAHAQFETIHPFVDGNGRTGRALLHAHLRNKQLVRRVTIPVSAGLLADTNAYFKALTAYRQGDIEPIVSQLAAASIRAAGLGRWLVDQLADVRDGWLKRLPSRTGSAGRRLASILVGQPAVNVTFVVERLGVSATAARRAIDQAIAAGLLVETSDRKRNRVWIAREALAVFDEFSDRAGRRV
ncbi:MAG TPA: Fic family protein [Propionicimonas sp.]|nr:Fic family protein [Propionicimonas sp.]